MEWNNKINDYQLFKIMFDYFSSNLKSGIGWYK